MRCTDILAGTDVAYTHVLSVRCEAARGAIGSLAARAAGLKLEGYGTATNSHSWLAAHSLQAAA
jgi:hypothetical protein